MSDVEWSADRNGGSASAPFDLGAWNEALQRIALHYGLPFSMAGSGNLADALAAGEPDASDLERLAEHLGLGARLCRPSSELLSSMRLPVAVQLKDGSVGVAFSRTGRQAISIAFSGEADGRATVDERELLSNADFFAVARPVRGQPDERVDAYIAPYREHWFRRIALADFGAYGYVFLASLVANILALAGVLFSMQVYDRVIPAVSYDTLYVLFAGVMLALLFDFAMRRVRTALIDIAGKRADMRMSDLIFGHALRVRNQARPVSTGTFIAQLRDLEQVRELLTSTTVAAVADIPFFILFLFVFWMIGGSLVAVPAAALVLLVLPGLLAQRRLRACANEAMRESSLRNAMLVEAVQGLEDIKSLQAEEHFQQRWNHFNGVSAQAQLRLRRITAGLTAWSHCVQTGTFAVVVLVGAPLVMAGDLTTGALVACSILGSRMIAPMAPLTQVLARFQQARIGLKSLDSIMRLPTDHPESEARISAPKLKGDFTIKGATFHYGEPAGRPALAIDSLRIEAGRNHALLGRNGAGKSTLLLALAGLIAPDRGDVLVDHLALSHIDPADLRANVGLLTQNSRLFHGSIRENLLLGAPRASQALLLDALGMVGADEFIARLPQGLEHRVSEGGRGLSGGQQQALLLARLLVRKPAIVLLDEPTASMDEATERKFITGFGEWAADRTVVIATHRMRVLDLIDRVIAIEGGRVVIDQPKDEAMKRLHGLKQVVAPKARRAAPVPANEGGA
nr:type I secretion system permease/ATPase [Aureimonas mangrovi]